MAIPSDTHYDHQKFQSITDVKVALERLELDIPKAKLAPLVNFNHTYLIITNMVKTVADENNFEHPGFLHTFDTIFAGYYIEAVKQHLCGNSLDVPPAWKQAFWAAEEGKASPFKCMVLGVNAHINNDIPQVLLKVDAQKKHARDYKFINEVITRSLDTVIKELDDDGRILSPKQKLFRPVYRLLMRGFVVLFRRLAWRNYHLLKRGKIHRYLIELRSYRVARLVKILPM